jgi:hypothetical protein
MFNLDGLCIVLLQQCRDSFQKVGPMIVQQHAMRLVTWKLGEDSPLYNVHENVTVNHGCLREQHQTRAAHRNLHLHLRLAVEEKDDG